MARLTGPLQIKGSIGALSFLETRDGIIVKEKTGTSREKMAHDPALEGSRQGSREFSRANAAGGLIRKAMRPLFGTGYDMDCINRLSSRLMKMLRSDMIAGRGVRRLENGDPELLEGFEFNASSPLHERMLKKPRITVAGNTWTAAMDSFIPDCALHAPKGTVSVKYLLAVSYLDFEANSFSTQYAFSEPIPYSPTIHPGLSFGVETEVAGNGLCLVLAGIRFYEKIDGELYPLDKGVHHSTAVVRAFFGEG